MANDDEKSRSRPLVLEQLEQLEQLCVKFFYMSRIDSKLCDSPFQPSQLFHFLLFWPRFGTVMFKLLLYEGRDRVKTS
jgi:hypothetical protein